MAKQKYSETSSVDANTFNKGMVKDHTEIYMPEGVWVNAINAINNTHDGETGTIGNEQSNKFCVSVPYTIIGFAHKRAKEWIIFSTNDTDSEIGVFDEGTCEYTQIVNDPCLNFKKLHPITAVVKENYDCTFSAYWQDNNNPDRVMNLDDPPYICFPKFITQNVNLFYYSAVLLPEVTDCDELVNAIDNSVYTRDFEVGSDLGTMTFSYDVGSSPALFIITYQGVDVVNTGFRGNAAVYNNTISHPTFGDPNNNDLVPVTGPESGSFTINKHNTEGTVRITVVPWIGREADWSFTLGCPVRNQFTPVQPELLNSITYVNKIGVTVAVDVEETPKRFCARVDSILNSNPNRIQITAGDPCGTVEQTIPDPDACGEEDCTEDLDCDALRLHPLVSQPCVRIKRAQGSGQLNNGSYMACIAYSEKGLKLTDYSTPSVPQALWDHSGIGGGIEIEIEGLDQNFDEYELVIVSVVNQQTVAKKIGNYSTDQNKITIDIINQDLETVAISEIPLKATIYEKSEKMFTVNNYLIRSSVTSQPFINYQKQANKIKVKWVAVRYPFEYYKEGGNNVGNMRDEVYPYFIRWIFKTGDATNTYHIPGRAPNANDLVEVSTNDVIGNRNKAWQVYDTTDPNSIDYPVIPSDRSEWYDPENRGVIIATGDMAYWESTERYPNESPEVWGELCGTPIRHHKMPSNETIHIHSNNGKYINVLGIQVCGVEHPLDEDGNPIEDIVGYEILRGSREGNRSVIAKGMFNNMRVFPYDNDGSGNNVKLGLYQNYPYNDLRPDVFNTEAPYIIESGDAEDPYTESPIHDQYALSEYKQDYFSFHSPETAFIRPYLGTGSYMKIYTEEKGTVNGNFRIPDKHPKHLLITDHAFVIAVNVGLGIALTSALGKTTTNASIGFSFVVQISSQVSRQVGGTPGGGIMDAITGGVLNSTGTAGLIAGTIGFIARFSYYTGKAVDEILRFFRAMLKDRQYALQYNSYGEYSSFKNIPQTIAPYNGSYTRPVNPSGIKYIGTGVQRINSTYIVNNLFRNRFVSVQLETGKTLPDPQNGTDNTRKRLIDIANDGTYNRQALYDNPTVFSIQTETYAYYGALKFDFDNQYGQIRSITQVPLNSCVYESGPGSITDTDVIFGGDTYINRYTEKNPYMFFNTWMYDLPDDTQWDYRNYINGPTPRYWVNFEKYDSDDFTTSLVANFQGDVPDETPITQNVNDQPDQTEQEDAQVGIIDALKAFRGNQEGLDSIDQFVDTPSDFHRLDRPSKISGKLAVKDSWFYLFYNGIRDFFCESELNMAFRDYGESDDEKFYDVYHHSFNDIDRMFRSDKITQPIFHKYDLSLSASKLFHNFATWSTLLPRDYDPEVYSTCFEFHPRRAIYSLQQVDGLKRDNWRNFLALNFKDFDGKINVIKPLNKTGAVILYEDAEPTLFHGVDSIETNSSGSKFTIGDAGLFSDQNIRAMVNADDALGYGTCISSRSAVNTPYGLYWISQDTGKIMHYSNQVNEISKEGMKFWFAENLPSLIRQNNPDYTLFDNPIVGTTCQTIYDPTYEILYFSKKDFIQVNPDLLFDSPNGIPYYLCAPNPEQLVPPEPTADPDCEPTCPPGYTLVDGVCQKIEITNPVQVGGTSFTLENGDQINVFGNAGLRLYEDITNLPLPIVGFGAPPIIPLTDNASNPITPCINSLNSNLWGLGSAGTGRLNNAGIWAPGFPEAQTLYNQWVADYDAEFGSGGAAAWLALTPAERSEVLVSAEMCFTFCVDIEVTKQYIIGLAGDNFVKFYVDDQSYVELTTNIVGPQSTEPFNSWWCFPVTLEAGTHKIRVCGLNISDKASFAAEIYEISFDDFIDPSTNITDPSAVFADLEPYIIFTTADYRTGGPLEGTEVPDPSDPGIFLCGEEEIPITDLCANEPSCVIIDEIEPTGCLQCTLEASETLVYPGQGVTLTWSTIAASTISSGGFSTGGLLDGSITVYPTIDTTYYIVATDSEGLTSVCSVQIQVKCDCPFDDDRCFKPAHWTVSYDPKNRVWLSFHDWIPDLMMPSNLHFLTVKDDSFWKHNENVQSYCNYYGVDYPWEIEYPIVTPAQITTLRNIEYTMEVYQYNANGKDFFHVLDENFDRAVIYNSEQISGLLSLNLQGKNTPAANLNFPSIGLDDPLDLTSSPTNEILFSKEENKYRFNQFWDITLNRGEFTPLVDTMWLTEADGVHKEINPAYVDYAKVATQRKKFRHYGNRLLLRKLVSGPNKMIVKVINSKHLLSNK